MGQAPILFLINFIGSLVCHQLPDRTLSTGGYYLPVCARCAGGYLGLLLGYLLLPLRRKRSSGPPNLLLTLLMIAPLIVDTGTQWIGLRTSTNEVRLITGLLFGTALAPLLVYVVSFVPTSKRTPVLKKFLPETAELDSKDPWLSNKSLVLGLLAALALYFVISLLPASGNIVLYWSLSMLIIVSVVWHIFLLPIILVILYAFSLRTRTG